jgi:NADPH:quinone reductase-like Zn-dependent oxidoreductase
VIGTGRAADRDRALSLGVEEFVDLETDRLEDAGEVDVVLDMIGGKILKRSTALVRAGGRTSPRHKRACFASQRPRPAGTRER